MNHFIHEDYLRFALFGIQDGLVSTTGVVVGISIGIEDKTGKHTDSLMIGALIMFFGYLLGGIVPIIPTILFNQPNARIIAIISALFGLFVLGYTKGHLVKVKPLRSALELLVIRSIATAIGLLVRYIFRV